MRMPEIEWPEDPIQDLPSNQVFLHVKLRHVEDMLYRLRPYIESLSTLRGVQGRKDIQDVVRFVLREFVSYYWDLPASKDYHHSGRWGLLYHSLEVALTRADEASRRVAVDAEGNPSAEAGRKHRGEQVLIAWLAGIFHDSGKIFDMDIRFAGPDRDIQYHPLRGNVLGFKLKFPEKNITTRWIGSRGMSHVRRNLAMFMCLAPLDLLKQLRMDQVLALFDGLATDGDAADQESVANYRYEQDSEYIREAIRLFARDAFRAKDNSGRVQPRIFALGLNTYALVMPVALQALTNYIKEDLGAEGYSKNHVTDFLVGQRYIYSSTEGDSSGNYFVKVVGYMKKARVTFHLAFAHGDLFADVDTSTLPAFKLEDDEETRDKVRHIVGFEPPEDWFLKPKPKKSQKTE